MSIRSRNRRCLSDTFPQLAASPDHLIGRSLVLDGEVVAFDAEGLPRFHALGFGRARRAQVAFVAFDVLYLDGELLIDQPYSARRARLVELGLRTSPWLTTPAADTVADAGELWGLTRDLRLEGVVAKRLDAPYRPGRRSATWLKLKHPHDRDLQGEPSSDRWATAPRRPVLPAVAYD